MAVETAQRPVPKGQLTAAQQALAAAHLPQALRAVQRSAVRYPYLEAEFRSAAGLALVECAARYAPDRHVTFAYYLKGRLYGAFQDVLRDEVPRGLHRRGTAPRARVVPLSSLRHVCGDSENGYAGYARPPEPFVDTKTAAPEAALAARDALERLVRMTPRHCHEALRLHFRDDLNYDEIAVRLGVVPSAITGRMRLALEEIAMGLPRRRTGR